MRNLTLNPISPAANPCCNCTLKIGVVLSLGIGAMRRRSRAVSKPANARSRKTAAPKGGNAPKSARHRRSPAASVSEQVALYKRERDEALEQQKATAEVLRVISSSPGELEPVFQAMLENATQLCEASFGALLLLEGDSFKRVARHNTPAKYAEFSDKNPLIRYRESPSLNRLIETKQAVHVSDMMVEEPEVGIAKFGNARTLLTVPMLPRRQFGPPPVSTMALTNENELIGAIAIYRQEVRPFTDKQIDLVKNFVA
jgi:hypothetical protein